eukprot:9608820-Alexandrium_andersonii.AAC.1
MNCRRRLIRSALTASVRTSAGFCPPGHFRRAESPGAAELLRPQLGYRKVPNAANPGAPANPKRRAA